MGLLTSRDGIKDSVVWEESCAWDVHDCKCGLLFWGYKDITNQKHYLHFHKQRIV